MSASPALLNFLEFFAIFDSWNSVYLCCTCALFFFRPRFSHPFRSLCRTFFQIIIESDYRSKWQLFLSLCTRFTLSGCSSKDDSNIIRSSAFVVVVYDDDHPGLSSSLEVFLFCCWMRLHLQQGQNFLLRKLSYSLRLGEYPCWRGAFQKLGTLVYIRRKNN